ncbi:adenosylcobinamide-GDP ribazoletransferase [Enterobacter sp.]|uniref:adenosylcobinamide-GDP ribazoletransferase n=1 Tax=Enterobacter sp. TaxID=42895 RepID=UPI00296F7363|nr:adenosylcobinamide-GDP ribazoletransferase [Enterobacter sp.]
MSKIFFATLSFITRLPVPARWVQGLSIDQYVRGIVCFPLVGVVLGVLSGLVFLGLQSGFGAPLAALFSVLALALLTGGFHLDGLADTCDGVFSARTRERMLEIMRDSRLGTHGGLALVFVLIAKILAVSELSLRGLPMIAVMASACAAGRGCAALLMYGHRYAREEGLGNLFIGKISLWQTTVTLGLTAVLAMAFLGMHGLMATGVTILVIYLLGLLLKRTLGGQTGDTLGAAIELGEVIFLLALLWQP